MNATFLQTLLIFSCIVYGLGSTRLMYWIINVVLVKLPLNEFLKNILTVIGWFVGGGAVMLSFMKVTDLSGSLGIREANGVAILCYVLGFGIGLLLIERWSKPSFIRDLDRFLTDDEIEVILLILRYRVDPEVAAATLSIPQDQINSIYTSALKKIQARGKTFIKSIADKRPR